MRDESGVQIEADALLSAFGEVADPRRPHRRRHRLDELLFVVVVGVVCGADGWVGVESLGESMLPWLRQFTPLEHGIPSHDTIGRVMRLLRPDALGEALASAAERIFAATAGRHVAMDGKTARRTFSDGDRNSALHMVTAWATEQGVALGQVAVDGKSNEQTAILQLIALLDLRGCLITIDAQGCQKKIAAALTEKKADYILMLKDNHPTACREVADFFAVLDAPRAGDAYVAASHHSTDGGHGRVEERRSVLCESTEWFADRLAWPGLRSFGMVESRRHVGDTVTVDRRWYLTTLKAASIGEFAEATRRHWAVENELHWVLDVGLREDESRVRTGHSAANLATVNRLVVAGLRRDKSVKVGAYNKRLKAAVDPSYRERMIRALWPEPSQAG